MSGVRFTAETKYPPTPPAPSQPAPEAPVEIKSISGSKRKPKFEDKYIMGDVEIGSGATAVVNLCTDKEGVEYAVKIMDRKNVVMDEEKFNEEISVLRKLKHPNIIRLHDVYKTKDHIMVVTELACGGELFDRLLDQTTFAEKDAAKIARRLFDAIRHMHEMGICHRDLKPENIMFKNNSKQSPLKIVDFGFASSLLDKKKKFRTMSQLGTMGYAAPEVFTGKPYTEKCDIWSLGVIVYILLCGYPPFVDMQDETKEDVVNTPFWVYINQMQTAVLSDNEDTGLNFPDKFWKHVSPAAKDFLKQVLVVDPNKRPRAADCLKHEWLAKDSLAKGKHLNMTMSNMRKFKNIRKSNHTMTLNANDISNLDNMFKLLAKNLLSSPEKLRLLRNPPFAIIAESELPLEKQEDRSKQEGRLTEENEILIELKKKEGGPIRNDDGVCKTKTPAAQQGTPLLKAKKKKHRRKKSKTAGIVRDLLSKARKRKD